MLLHHHLDKHHSQQRPKQRFPDLPAKASRLVERTELRGIVHQPDLLFARKVGNLRAGQFLQI